MPDHALRADYERVDWARTALGPVQGWSPTLHATLDLVLETRFGVALFWGPDFVLLYNEAYVPVLAEKHPGALGRPIQEVFPEAWPLIGPWMRAVRADEDVVWIEDAPVPLLRHGRLEESYFTFCYSPVRDPSGRVEGVIDIVSETTSSVIDRRRLAMLGRLREMLAEAREVPDAFAAALSVLRENAGDLPDVSVIEAEPGFFARASELRLPLREGRVLSVRLSEHLAHDETYIGFLGLAAAAVSQAVDRIRAREAEHAVAEALQRSLLTDPPAVPGLSVTVRYRPAAERARVGGDWYDAFVGPDGALRLVVGDVTGHDQASAAAMGQFRGLLRGVAWTSGPSPAKVLSALDVAVDGLDVGTYATVLMARVGDGSLSWSSAGHPPPVLVGPDGTACLLGSEPEPLIGLGDASISRTDHSVALAPGSMVVFYTDGLIERRDARIDARIAWLVDLLSGRVWEPDALCEMVLTAAGEGLEDDIALLVLHVT
jgi:hypothetical protein